MTEYGERLLRAISAGENGYVTPSFELEDNRFVVTFPLRKAECDEGAGYA